jgi:Mce-associated membrane protein
MIALLVLVLGLGAASVVFWYDAHAMRADEEAGQEALAAARTVAPDLLSYDYRTVEQDLARATERTTGELAKHYKELSTGLAAKAKAEKTVQTAAVADGGVESTEGGRVEVLLFVNMGTEKQIAGKTGRQYTQSKNRARFVMVRQGSRWLVADLSTLIGTA